MLTIKTKLKEVRRKGIGLFADENIKKGQVVWKYNPIIDIKVKKNKITPELKQFFHTYGIDHGKDYIFLNIDNERFINHSKKPNIKSLGDFDENIAIRNIKKGEELTIDYDEIDVEGKGF